MPAQQAKAANGGVATVKVFVSSVMRGQQEWRDAVRSAIETLGLQAVMAEDFGASPSAPRTECLAAVRDADVMILILGTEYGQPMESGFSATHEEYREALELTPVLAFVHDGSDRSGAQARFVNEVRAWESGHYTGSFSDAAQLRDSVLRALFEFQGGVESMPLDANALNERAGELLPQRGFGGSAELVVAVAVGPARAVLTASQLVDAELHRCLLREALTGTSAVLSTSVGTQQRLTPVSIVLDQHEDRRRVELHTDGSIMVALPAIRTGSPMQALPAIIEEDISDRVTNILEFAGSVLDQIDPANRTSHFAVQVLLSGAEHVPWRTRGEQASSPHSAVMNIHPHDRLEVHLAPPVRIRPALRQQSRELADDLTARLKLAMRSDPWHR
jgi:hypothetical protein